MAWKILNLDLPNIPKILVKCHLEKTGYRIDLTDLSRIWSESSSKDDIIHRALDLGSSIDASEDDEQFKILLGKIESALNCEAGTSIRVSTDGEDGSKLRIDLSAPLPQPLPPFKWTLQLEKQPESRIESEVVTPLVLQSSNLKVQIQQLIDELHDKDRVISKICDRLETSGNDLTTVFPGVSNIKTSRKKGQREQLAKHVRGLEDFDEDVWRKSWRSASSNESLDINIIDEVFRDLPSNLSKPTTLLVSNLWEHLHNESEAKLASQATDMDTGSSKTDRRQSRTASALENEGRVPHDDFQRQGTPSHLKSNATERDTRHVSIQSTEAGVNGNESQARPAMQVDDESTTDEEDDLDAAPRAQAPSKKWQSVNEQTPASPAPGKLGVIGGRSPHSKPTEDADGAGRDDIEAPKTRSKLGTIGGRPKASITSSVAIEDTEPVEESPPSKASKMGVIGSRESSKTTLPPADNEGLSDAAKEPSLRHSRTPLKENTPPPRETSEERADRKRDQLKRELEEKAKAPVKKKRKF